MLSLHSQLLWRRTIMRVDVRNYNLWIARGVVVITAAIVWFVFNQNYQAKLVFFNAQTSKLNKQAARFKSLNDMTLLVKEYEEKFKAYMPIEQYEHENRLLWLDSLDVIRIKHKIPKLNYVISPRKKYDYKDELIKAKGLNVSFSDIKLTMSLMHEADLIYILKDLENIKPSIHLVNSCELKRISKGSGSNLRSAQPNVDAICHIKWFTFKV